MIPTEQRWLHRVFAASSLALVVLVGIAMAREAQRPVTIDQRIVTALGVVDRCETCHDDSKHSGKWLEQHPLDRFGCTPCHGGQGLATNKLAAHAASPDWERPLFTKAQQQAACGSCHLGTEAPVPIVAQGRKALAERGCTGCHAIPGVAQPDFAPELDGMRDKVQPAWLRAWLTDPAKVDLRHRMPTFRLAKAEVEALTAFLLNLPGAPLRPLPTGLEGDAERGRQVVAKLRCATCHRFEGRGGEFGPDLGVAGMKLDGAWFWNLLTDTHRLRPHTRMPGFRLADQEAADIVAFAAEQWVPDSGVPPWQGFEGPVDAALAPKGKALFAELGCGGCHRVAGERAAASAVALDRLGDRRVVDLPAPDKGPRPRDVPAWAARKITEPMAFDQKSAVPSRMPTFPQLQPGEAEAMAVALATGRTHGPPEAWLRRNDLAPFVPPQGEVGHLITRFRCLSCHRVGGQGSDVARIALDGAGSRLRRPWLDRFLRDPVTVRMDQAERMPLLGLSETEAQRLAGWLEATLGDDRIGPPSAPVAGDSERGRTLYAQHQCGACHVGGGGGTMKGPTLDGCSDRLQPGYLEALLRSPELVPAARHPLTARLSAEEARAVAAYVSEMRESQVAPP